MDTIFHEKQEGSLCAQHCLNALLQGPYFTPVDLATLGQQMDDEERMRMAESGIDTDDYRRFLEQPSGNMDDSGYFSVQVINSALDVWGLELVPYNSTEPRAILAQQDPTEMKAFICNYRDHWFTIRRLGLQWFNLNSLLTGPELISNTYLSMFLAQLQQEGYSIFVVFGNLPECTADEVLRAHPVVPNIQPRIISPTEDADLQRALQLSLSSEKEPGTPEVDPDLERALRLSLGQSITPSRSEPELGRTLPLSLERMQTLNLEDDEEDDLQKALRLSLSERNNPLINDTVVESVNVETSDSSDSELEAAIRLSLASPPTPVSAIDEVNVAELRQRRLAYLETTLRPHKAGGGLHHQEHCK